MKNLIDQIHSYNMRVILWATSMVNKESFNFQEMVDNRYHLTNAKGEPELVKWWHGHGLFIDYTNKNAVDWWHKQLDNVLDLGIDGWKTDGTDPSVMLIGPLDPRTSSGAKITSRQYSDQYYTDFFEYTRTRNPTSLIMSRPVDCQGGACYEFSPRQYVLAGWVGDDYPTWEGLRGCISKMAYSAWNTYPNFGCDMAGYKGAKEPQPVDLYVRWVQLGAVSPLMENGGNNEHRPWKFDAPGQTTIVDMYRNFVNFHHSILPYLLTTGANALARNHSSITPMSERTYTLKDFAYLLGPDYFVVPITEENVTNVTITLPGCVDEKQEPVKDCESHWSYIFDSTSSYPSGKSFQLSVPQLQYPIFVRHSAFVPLRIDESIAAGVQTMTKQAIARLAAPDVSPAAVCPRALASMVEKSTSFVSMMGDASSSDAYTMMLVKPKPTAAPVASSPLRALDRTMQQQQQQQQQQRGGRNSSTQTRGPGPVAVAARAGIQTTVRSVRPFDSLPFTADYLFEAERETLSLDGHQRVVCGRMVLAATASDIPVIFAVKGVIQSHAVSTTGDSQKLAIKQVIARAADLASTGTPTITEFVEVARFGSLAQLKAHSSSSSSSSTSSSSAVASGYVFDEAADTLLIRPALYAHGLYLQLSDICIQQ